MTSGSQQPVDDYEQLKSSLELYPKINIIKTEGQPPDNYEIKYSLKGVVKEADGSIEINDSHRIHISLPFGYPHFPPTVKPLTNIFHPDIDPAAIRIAEQWQNNPSLADLVLHIGEMISGTIYNVNEPFNQEAADWYSKNASKLPCDTLNIVDMEAGDQAIDDLIDDTFASLGLESDDFLEPEKEFDPEDVEALRDLISRKALYSANRFLAEIPDSDLFTERDSLQQKIDNGLKKAEEIFSLAEELESIGKTEEAVELIGNLDDIVSDMPGSEALISRLKEAYALTPLSKDEVSDESVPPPPTKKKKKTSAKTQEQKKAKSSLPKIKLSLPRINLKVTPRFLVAIIIIPAIFIVAAILFVKDQNEINESQTALLKANLFIEKKQFKEAEKSLKDAQDTLSSITILRHKKASLKQRIESLTSSKKFKEGLKGHVLYRGKYLPADQVSALKQLEAIMTNAQEKKKQNKTIEALNLYKQALQVSRKAGQKQQATDIQNLINALELQQFLARAEKAEQGQNWQQAAEIYRQTLELASNISDFATANNITSRLLAASFRHELHQSKETFVREQWQETINKLERAQTLIDKDQHIVSTKERKDLHRLLVNAKLYSILSTARTAYTQKNWTKAITEYQNALNLLDKETGSFDEQLDKPIEKISKTLFMIQLTQMQEDVFGAENEQDLARVIDHSKKIVSFITESEFGNDPDALAAKTKILKEIRIKEEEFALSQKINWLEDNYEKIFRKNYPTFSGSRLLKPNATLLEKVGNKSIFLLTCTEKSRGSSSRLELNYQHNHSTGKWSVYTGNQAP